MPPKLRVLVFLCFATIELLLTLGAQSKRMISYHTKGGDGGRKEKNKEEKNQKQQL